MKNASTNHTDQIQHRLQQSTICDTVYTAMHGDVSPSACSNAWRFCTQWNPLRNPTRQQAGWSYTYQPASARQPDPSPSKQLRATVNSSLQSFTSNLGKNRSHQDSTPKSRTSTAPKRIDVCHRAHLATPSMDAGFASALRDRTATFALSFLRPRALTQRYGLAQSVTLGAKMYYHHV